MPTFNDLFPEETSSPTQKKNPSFNDLFPEETSAAPEEPSLFDRVTQSDTLSTLGEYGKAGIKGVSQNLLELPDILNATVKTPLNYLKLNMLSEVPEDQRTLGNAFNMGLSYAPELEKARLEYVGDPEFETPTGRILGKGVEYLTGAPLGGGVVRAALAGIGGGTAKEFGLPEWLGALTPAGLETAGRGALAGFKSLFSSAPSETQALKQVFSATGPDAAFVDDALPKLKERGLIANPTETQTPFADTLSKLETENINLHSKIVESLKTPDKSFKAGELLDELDTPVPLTGVTDEGKKIVNTIEGRKLRTRIQRNKKDDIIAIALEKLYPDENVDDLMSTYKTLLKEDPKAAASITKEIKNVTIPGDEVWSIRQGYDDSAKHHSLRPTKASQIYRSLRDRMQKKILSKAGEDSEFADLFKQSEQIYKTLPAAEKLAIQEGRGLTQEAPLLNRAATSGIRGAAREAGLGFGKKPAAQKLRQAFGETAPQKILAPGLAVPLAKTAVDAVNSRNQSREEDLQKLQQQSSSNKSNTGLSTSSSKSSSKSAFIDDAISRAEAKMEGVTPSESTKSSDPMDSLLDAVEMQESGGDVNAISSEGAEGAYQFLPSTGRQYAKKLGVRYNPKNKAQQREIARAYLSDLLEMFDGDVGLALTGYHSGENRVKRLLRETGGSTLEDIRPLLGEVGKKYATGVLKRIPQLKQMGV